MIKQALFLAALAVPMATVWADSYVYVSIGGEKRIAIHRLDGKSGKLTHFEDKSLDGAPGSLAVDPERKFLFAAIRSKGGLGSFRIDAKTGGLSSIGSIDVGASCAYVATDRTGRFLFSAYYGAGKVGVHRIRPNGMLDGRSGKFTKTVEKAHAILPDLSNKYVFVPHTGPNAVFQFSFDEKTGSLKPNAVPRLTTPTGTQPRHLAFHPNKRFAYFDNERGSSVTVFTLDASSGTLSPIQTISTLPAGFKENNSCADIEIHPSGKFLYSSNRGHDSIACFAVNAETGKLTSLGQAATEKTPRSFNIDPSGKFLYAAGQSSGKLASYRIDADSGTLKRFDTFAVGKGPSWVQVVDMPK